MHYSHILVCRHNMDTVYKLRIVHVWVEQQGRSHQHRKRDIIKTKNKSLQQ